MAQGHPHLAGFSAGFSASLQQKGPTTKPGLGLGVFSCEICWDFENAAMMPHAGGSCHFGSSISREAIGSDYYSLTPWRIELMAPTGIEYLPELDSCEYMFKIIYFWVYLSF